MMHNERLPQTPDGHAESNPMARQQRTKVVELLLGGLAIGLASAAVIYYVVTHNLLGGSASDTLL